MEIVRLEEICELITDGTHQTPTYSKEGYIFLSSKNVTSRKIDWQNIKYISEELHRELIKRVIPKKNDILLAKNGTTGVGAIVDKEIEFDIYVSLALLRPNDKVLPRYLFWAVNSPAAKRKFDASLKGIGVKNLHLSAIKKIEINIYNKETQEKIIKVLDKLQKILEERQKLLENLDLLSKCLFSFATKRARNLLLNEVADITMGQSPDSKYYNTLKEGLPFFQGKTEFGENYIKEIKYYCSCPLKIAEENTILMSVRAPVGAVNISKVRCCIGRGLAAIVPKKIQMLYLFFALKNLEKEIERKGVGSTFKAITKKDIEKIEIPIIEIKEQVDFVNKILKIEKSKFEIQKSIEETQKLFDSLMEKYFG